jgi:hypothetical protein
LVNYKNCPHTSGRAVSVAVIENGIATLASRL